MASYSDWLEGLTKCFFAPMFRDRRVRLVVTRDLLDEHFGYLGGTVSFLSAMRKGPDWAIGAGDRSMHAFGLALYAEWKRPRRPREPIPFEKLNDVPAYLPYLCLLCLAWTEGNDEDFADHAYYSRLETLFPGHKLTYTLGDWTVLWKGLENWTNRMKGEWGVFEVEQLGGMPYVGIPKAQVIFTPRRIERMRDLFASLGLPPSALIDDDTMVRLLAGHEGPARNCLGNRLVDEITRESALGKSALKILLEHLRHWDGGASQRSRRPNGTTPHATVTPASPLLLVLEADKGDSWRLRFGLENDKDCEALEFPGSGWRFRSTEPPLALAATQGEDLVDAGSYLSGATAFTLEGKWRDSGIVLEAPRYVFKQRKAWMFESWTANQRLVESRRITNNSGIYLLLTAHGLLDWRRWAASRSQTVATEDYTAMGLPRGFTLLWVTGLDRLQPTQLSGFPGMDGPVSVQPRVIWMAGGTLVTGVASRRTYAEYDPPIVSLQADRLHSLRVDGAEPKLLSEGKPVGGRPGELIRTYSLTVKPESAVVMITATKAGVPVVPEISFGVARDVEFAGSARGAAHVDHHGDLFEGPGIQGAAGGAGPSTWDYQELRGDPGAPATPELLDKGPFRLLESLHLAGKRLTIQEYRRRAQQVTGAEPWRHYMETRWLSSLAHVEVQVDDRGRWSHVHPVSRQMYLLPWVYAGRKLAVVSGCGTVEQLRKVVANATAVGCQPMIKAVKAALVPPRLLLMHRDTAALEKVARQHGITWVGYPAADAVVSWSGTLETWIGSPSLRWHDQRAPQNLPEYVPSRFQMSESEENHAPARLFWMLDPYSQRHYWHVLERKASASVTDNTVRHAFLRDPAWAKWKTHLAVADGDETLVPFIVGRSVVDIPRELHLPYLLSRALCLCSGLPPAQARFSPSYADSSVGVLPAETETPRYEGECWEYLDVPRPIAEKVARKLGGLLKDIIIQANRR